MKLALLVALTMGGCKAGIVEPVCGVVSIMDEACELVTVEYIDENGQPRAEAVPKEKLKMAAEQQRMRREKCEELRKQNATQLPAK